MCIFWRTSPIAISKETAWEKSFKEKSMLIAMLLTLIPDSCHIKVNRSAFCFIGLMCKSTMNVKPTRQIKWGRIQRFFYILLSDNHFNVFLFIIIHFHINLNNLIIAKLIQESVVLVYHHVESYWPDSTFFCWTLIVRIHYFMMKTIVFMIIYGHLVLSALF